MTDKSRRNVIKTMVTAGAAIALSDLAGAKSISNDSSQTTPNDAGRVFAGQHQPKNLPFDPAKLNGISEKLIKSHWENNYGGAVKALNAVEQRLGAMLQDK